MHQEAFVTFDRKNEKNFRTVVAMLPINIVVIVKNIN